MLTTVDHITALISARYGLQIRADWPPVIERSIVELLASNGYGTDELIGEIEANPNLLDNMMARLTVPETHFMRHHEHFSFLAQEMSRRIRQAPAAASLRIVSAGCSSGEEIYTLAMILGKEFTHYPKEQIEILGCDISLDAVIKARQAVYRAWSFRRTPGWLLEEFFDVADNDSWRVKDYLRDRVRLDHCAIQEFIGGLGKHSVDVILFRNVGIYFLEDALQQLFTEFHRALKTDGYLVVAPGDPRPQGWHFRRVDHSSTSIYRAQALPPTGSSRIDTPPVASERRRITQDCSAGRQKPVASAGSRAHACTAANPQPQAVSSRPNEAVTIRQLADRGEFAEALELASRMVERAPSRARGYLLRGQLYFSGHREEDNHLALEDFRRAVFVHSDNALARFWYASALSRLRRTKKALLQLEACIALLDQGDAFSGLEEDDDSNADELRRAVVFMREELQ